MKKYSVAGLLLLLMGCGVQPVDEMDKTVLMERINSSYEAENYTVSREASESFIARFPNDEQIDVVRLKLLASYIYSSRYKLASAYAERLLQGSLLNETYYEDVEYYQIVMSIEKSKHIYGKYFPIGNIYRNFSELDDTIAQLEGFLAKYPNSAYTDDLLARKTEIRTVIAEYHLNIALHYAKKGNQEAVQQRLEIYYDRYSDVETKLLDKVLSYT